MVVEFLETVLLHFKEFELEWKQLNPLRWDESYTLCEIRRGLSYRTVVKLHLYYFRGCSNDVSRSTAEILITVYGKIGVCYAQRHSMSKTRSSATADATRYVSQNVANCCITVYMGITCTTRVTVDQRVINLCIQPRRVDSRRHPGRVATLNLVCVVCES